MFHSVINLRSPMGNQSFCRPATSETRQCYDPVSLSFLLQAEQSTLQPTGVPGHQQVKFWRERVKDWYPALQRQTYFLPSVYMNRTQHREEEVCGQKISVTQEPSSQCPDYSQGSGEPRPKRQRRGVLYESDAVDDEANRRVLSHLQKFQDTEVMFVVSQMQFGNYLNKPAYAAAASMLPKPGDLAQDKQRGDFDILIIHRHYGILACEIKAVGSKFSELLTTEQDKDDILVKKVKDAIKQMQKARDVLRYLVSKDERQPMIRTVLMLPNITRARLHRVLHNRQQILEVTVPVLLFYQCKLVRNVMFSFETVTILLTLYC